MPDLKISGLAVDAAPSGSDYVETLDVSDATMGASGTNKRVLLSQLFATLGGGGGGGGGSGTVTTASVASANGFGGTVTNATTTPAITITTSVAGLLKGDGTGVSAAAAGTDYLAPGGSGAALTGIASTQVSGLGTAATHPATDFLLVANNLSDVTAATARANLGLGTAATQASSAFDAAGSAAAITATSIGAAPAAGSTSIVTLGTVATGVWSATAIGVTKGGTGLTGVASGKLLYASATDTLAPLTLGTNLSITTGTLNAAGSTYATFVASGAAHAGGLVPDPGASAGTAKFLREDATWATPPGPTVGGSVASGTNNRVLYQNSSGNLAESANLAYDGSNLTTNGLLAVADGQRIGADTSGRFSVTAFAVSSIGTPSPGEIRWGSGTTMVRMDGTLALGSGVIIRWSSGDPTAVGCDVSLYRQAVGVVSVGSGSNSGPGGLASAPNTPATLAADTNNYSPGVGLFQRWSASTPVNVTGMAAGQAGEVRYMVNVGTNAITLPHQSASSTSANRWLTTTGSSLAWGANQMVFAIYDATTAAWRVSLLP